MFPPVSDFDTEVTMESQPHSTDEEMPFRILFLGDWSGRESRSSSLESPDFEPIEIDRDNFDDVMKRFSVNLILDFEGDDKNKLSLEFTEIDDFHPDQIFRKLPVFANLREIRKKLLNSSTFNEAAREVNSWLTTEQNEAENITESEITSTSNQPTEDLLDQILGNADANNSDLNNEVIEKTGLSGLISKLVKPHLIQTDATEQSKLLLIVDEVITDIMRKILHHPRFQALESAWRGAYFLVKRIKTDANLKIFLMDVGKSEIIADLKSVVDLTSSSLYKVLDTGTSGKYSNNESWSIIGGNYSFSLNVEDIAFLIRMAKIADEIDSPFVSHLNSELLNSSIFNRLEEDFGQKNFEDSSENKLWVMLRSTPEADYLGLLLPRFLARLPYGEQTEPVESFSFEELAVFEKSESYLWTNPAFICVLLLAETYTESGWDILRNLTLDVNNLPMHFYQENNETKNTSCTEISLTEKNCERLLDFGLMPLVSFYNLDKIRLVRLQSASEPISTLRGKWS